MLTREAQLSMRVEAVGDEVVRKGRLLACWPLAAFIIGSHRDTHSTDMVGGYYCCCSALWAITLL